MIERNPADGATRIGATVFQEVRNAVFASVAQKAIRRVACGVYGHLLKLDLNFHLTRQTGGLTRAIDRGTKGISFLLTSMVFHVLPTAVEISLVCGILVGHCGFVIAMALTVPDLSVRCQVCSHHWGDHGCVQRLHHLDDVLENEVSKTS